MSDIYKSNPVRPPREGWPDRPDAPSPRRHTHRDRGYAWLLVLLLVLVLGVALYFAARLRR